MSKKFDPNAVERVNWYWRDGHYRVDKPSIDSESYVTTADYDSLLALYSEAIARIGELEMKGEFWPCKEGLHEACAKNKWVDCSCSCHSAPPNPTDKERL